MNMNMNMNIYKHFFSSHPVTICWYEEAANPDKGGEFKSRDLDPELVCSWRGIVHTFTDTAAQQSNGVVERRIGLLKNGVRSCLLRCGLPPYLWVEAYLRVAHAHILLPSRALLNRETRIEGRKRKLADVMET